MIKCERNDKTTTIEARGSAMTLAADCCEIISAIYAAVPTNLRQAFKASVFLAVSHKDSPMWQSPPPSSERVVIRSEGEEFLKQAKELFGSENHPEGAAA